MSIEIRITDNKDKDLIELIRLLDDELTKRNGEIQKLFDPLNSIINIEAAVVLYNDREPAACGAYKIYDTSSIEMKRIYVRKDQRRKGFAREVLFKLEELAKERGYRYALLETGTKQFEAIQLYHNSGYQTIPNFVPYIGNEHSICMRKALI